MAELDPDLAALAADPTLAGLDPADLAALADQLIQMVFVTGAEVAREGGEADAMDFILEGTATVSRAGLELGELGPGGHVGELGLFGPRKRVETVTARRPLRVARLTRARYLAFAAERPRAATRFCEAIIRGIGGELGALRDSFGRLLGDRLLPRRAEVEVTLPSGKASVATGTVIREIVPEAIDGSPVVAARLDARPVSLETSIVADVTVEPLVATSDEGREIVRRSAGLLVLELVRQLAPDVALRFGPQLDASWPIAVLGPVDDVAGLASRVGRALAAAIEARTRFREEVWTVEEARDELSAPGAGADLLDTWRDPVVPLISCGRRYALRTGPVVPHAGALAGTRVEAFGGGLVLRFADPPGDGDELAVERRAPRFGGEMVEEGARWRAALGALSVGAFNRACVNGQVNELIRVAEGFHEKWIGRVADAIVGRAGKVRAIAIAGPSSSGKTTFIRRLTTQLLVAGVRPVGLSLDDYYVDRERTPRGPDGAYDFEALEAIDLAALRRDVARVMAGERVTAPRYDFKTGRSIAEGGAELSLARDEILLLEGIHGLDPRLLADAVAPDALFRIFVHPATTLPLDGLSLISPHDLRLLRRIVRDRRHRSIAVADNLARWRAVRDGDRRHIYPFLPDADVVFDSALVYEPAVIKVYAERYLLEVPRSHPSFVTADRLRQLVDRFVAIYPDHVPPTSLLREFIGGSGFEYG